MIGNELAVSEQATAPATQKVDAAVQPTLVPEGLGSAVVAEVLAARAQAAAATAEAERLRERVRVLESWLEAAAQRRKVEYVQAQRLAMMKAVERDQRVTFVLSLPLVLLVLYCATLIALVWLLAMGRV
ncbi:MAG TPA: hypothetical protein VF232_12820 [Gaiellaceae bacterium]